MSLKPAQSQQVSPVVIDFSYMDVNALTDLASKEPRGWSHKENVGVSGPVQAEAGLFSTPTNSAPQQRPAPNESAPLTHLTQIYNNFGSSLANRVGPKTTTARSTKKAEPETHTFNLGYNKIRSAVGIVKIVRELAPRALDTLQWLDLQHNYLVSIPPEIAEFSQLKVLYLHSNYISDMSQFTVLVPLSKLISITVHSNPIVRIPNFRLFVVAILPHVKKIDSVLVSEKEREATKVWAKTYSLKRLPAYKADDCPKPPKLVEPKQPEDL